MMVCMADYDADCCGEGGIDCACLSCCIKSSEEGVD